MKKSGIRLIIKAYISFMGTRTNIPRIMAREMAEGGEHFAIIMQRYISRNYAVLQDTIKSGVEKGVFSPVDLTLSPLCMIGMMVFFFFASPTIKRILNRQEYDREFLEQLTAQVTYIFFNGIKKHDSEEE
ncbi:MAG: CerR family C-terminal domain-containing protein [Candidatus Xenobiia bacterium LiM19]